MTIQHERNEKNGRFVMMDDDREAAYITYVWAGDTRFIIDHTEVSPDYEGRGLGKLLVAEAVRFARERKVMIMPLCPFAQALFRRTSDYADIWYKTS